MAHQLLPPTSVSDSRKVLEDFLGVLGALRRGWRFIAISVAVALTLGGIYLARAKPTYQATARLLILQQGGQPVSVASNHLSNNGDLFQSASGAANSLATHVMIVRSPLIVERAIAL